MNRKLASALTLIGLTVVILILNGKGSVSVNFLVGRISGLKSLVFLGFTAVGVVIGLLLK